MNRIYTRCFFWGLAAVAAISNVAEAQIEANAFWDDTKVQTIHLTMDPADWSTLQQHYLENTYYHATFKWNGVSEDVGVRSHGGASRSPVKPNLDLNFSKYTKKQTFLGLPFLVAKANNQDPSNLREWISMKLYRRMGVPAPREVPAQVYVNGQLLGFFFIVEHVDESFLDRNFGEDAGYLYQWEATGDGYDFGNLGTDPNVYAPYLDLKTDQDTPDLQTFTDLVQVINQPASDNFKDADFIAALSHYMDPKAFLLYGAIEQVLAGSDGFIGGLGGLNNFYLYQLNNTTSYQPIAWDKDFAFSVTDRDILDGITFGNINVLVQRLYGIPEYRQAYLRSIMKAAGTLQGSGGWADQELTREYNVIHSAAVNDPNKLCPMNAAMVPCGAAEFEKDVAWLHTFLGVRSTLVTAQAIADGYQPPSAEPQISSGGITMITGGQDIAPGALVNVTGFNLGTAVTASTVPLPRVLQNTYVTVDGMRTPLFSTDAGKVELQVPDDLAIGTSDVVVWVNGVTSTSVPINVKASSPGIVGVIHASNGTGVSPANPAIPGEVISIYAVGLGGVKGDPASGAAAPADPPLTTSSTPEISAGSVPLDVVFSGLAPGFVGLYQINAVVPASMDPNESSFTLIVNGETAAW